jgi:hypothetical protein
MTFIPCKNRKEAVSEFPEAYKILKVDGGYAVFFYVTDYNIWRNQK